MTGKSRQKPKKDVLNKRLTALFTSSEEKEFLLWNKQEGNIRKSDGVRKLVLTGIRNKKR